MALPDPDKEEQSDDEDGEQQELPTADGDTAGDASTKAEEASDQDDDDDDEDDEDEEDTEAERVFRERLADCDKDAEYYVRYFNLPATPKNISHIVKVWYGMVWYGMVWYSMVWYGVMLMKLQLS